jgi:hypothetical protein
LGQPSAVPSKEQPTLPSPAAQLAPAFVSFGLGPDTPLTIRLHPAELGQVQIGLIHAPDGTPTVRISAERPETLALLRDDQGQLHAALDLAGIARVGRVLDFQLVPAHGANGWPSGEQHNSGAESAPQGQNPSGGDALGFGNSGRNGTNSNTGGRRRRSGLAIRAAPASLLRSAWLRAGIDITA